jgi:CheY-like chemotaxis protein
VPALNNLRVLVIDDDEIAREFLCGILRAAGFDVLDSPSTIGVTNKIVKDRVQVVVLDVMMPTIRGDKLAGLLRKNVQLSQLGVVLVSGAPREELDELASELDAHAIVSKQDARAELADAVLLAAQSRTSRPRV